MPSRQFCQLDLQLPRFEVLQDLDIKHYSILSLWLAHLISLWIILKLSESIQPQMIVNVWLHNFETSKYKYLKNLMLDKKSKFEISKVYTLNFKNIEMKKLHLVSK